MVVAHPADAQILMSRLCNSFFSETVCDDKPGVWENKVLSSFLLCPFLTFSSLCPASLEQWAAR